jgi:uncharacterized protein YegL
VKAIKFPEGFVCEHCVVQLTWKDSNEEYYTCSDVIPPENELSTCLGKKEECKNSEVCGGTLAVGYKKSNGSSVGTYLLALLGVIGIAAAVIYGYNETKDTKSDEPQTSEYKKLEHDVLTSEKNNEKLQDTTEVRHEEVKEHESEFNVEYKKPVNYEDEKEIPETKEDERKEPDDKEGEQKKDESKEDEGGELENGELEAKTEDYQVPDPEEVKGVDITAEEDEETEGETESTTKNVLLKVMEEAFMLSIKKVVKSNQLDYAKDFVHIAENGKFIWEKTHFIFIIDCSGSMKGKRWEAVNIGLQACLRKLKPMKDNLVSGFTFDDQVNPLCRERPTANAVAIFKRLPFTARGTNYKRALEYGLKLITTSKSKSYLHCVLFLSDGTGGYPKDVVLQLKDMKEKKRNILFYTIACETDEEKDMIRMAEELSGEHYKVAAAEAARVVFTSVLGL